MRTILLFLAGFTAFGFLAVVGRNRQMPSLLKAFLIGGALVIVIFVAWALFAGL